MSDKNDDKQYNPKRLVGRPPLQFPDLIDADPADVAKTAFKLKSEQARFRVAVSQR